MNFQLIIDFVTYYFAILIQAFNRVNIEAISDINLNYCLIALENVTVRSQLGIATLVKLQTEIQNVTYF